MRKTYYFAFVLIFFTVFKSNEISASRCDSDEECSFYGEGSFCCDQRECCYPGQFCCVYGLDYKK